MRIASGTTDQYIYFYAVDATDFTTPETGLSSFTVYSSRNGGAAAAMGTLTINETDSSNMPGVYELLMDDDMTLDAGDDEQEKVFHISHAGMAPVVRTITIFRNNVTAWKGDTAPAMTGDAYARLGAPAGASVSADIAALPQIADCLTAADVSDAVWEEAIADHSAVAGSTAKAVADVLEDTATTIPATLTTISGYVDCLPATWVTVPTAEAISDAVWDEAATGHTDAGKAGAQLWTDIDAILEDTGTTLPTATEVADAVLTRGVQNVEDAIAAAGGSDAKDFLCLGSIILATFESGISSTTWTINETDGSTALFTRTLTVDETGTAKPITDVT